MFDRLIIHIFSMHNALISRSSYYYYRNCWYFAVYFSCCGHYVLQDWLRDRSDMHCKLTQAPITVLRIFLSRFLVSCPLNCSKWFWCERHQSHLRSGNWRYSTCTVTWWQNHLRRWDLSRESGTTRSSAGRSRQPACGSGTKFAVFSQRVRYVYAPYYILCIT